ncbi:MAG: hypothetical protein M3N14_10620 [Bacteroidota bacterium]|nr:hypothetical protein [Bacteroidota bacterium]
MKRLLLIAVLFEGCNRNGRYVNHSENQYAIPDDTLEIRDSIIISHSGFQRIRNCVLEPKQYKTQQLFDLKPVFQNNQLILNNTRYEKM